MDGENVTDTLSDRFFLALVLLLGASISDGVLRYALFAGATLLFSVSIRVGDETLLAWAIRSSRKVLTPLQRRALILLLEFLVPRFDRLVTHFRSVEAKLKREKRAEQLIDRFLDTAREDLGMDVPQLDSEDHQSLVETISERDKDLAPETTFESIASAVFSDAPQDEVEARLISVLTVEADKAESSTERHEIVSLIDRLLSGRSFHPLGDSAGKVLTAYEAFRLEEWEETRNGPVFERDRTREDYELSRKFLREYTTEQRFQHILKTNQQIEEFRATLADLVRSGKLDVGNIHEDVIDEKLTEVENELREREGKYSSYILISNHLVTNDDHYGATSSLESKFQTIRIGTWKIYRNGDFETVLLSTRLVYSSREFPDTETFLEEEVKPLLPPEDEHKDGAFVAAMPFEAPEYVSYPSKERVVELAESEWWESTTEQNFENIEELQIGTVGIAAKIATESISREVSVEELLRVIPFNIVAPKMEREKKRVIRDNYQSLKATFGVDTLFNWVDVNPSDLADELYDLEPEISHEEWEETASEIIDGIEECGDATKIHPTPAM